MLGQAAGLQAALVTTPKDAVRLPPDIRSKVTVIGVGLRWHAPERIDQLLDKAMAGLAPVMR